MQKHMMAPAWMAVQLVPTREVAIDQQGCYPVAQKYALFILPHIPEKSSRNL